jgi:hypothetical protein
MNYAPESQSPSKPLIYILIGVSGGGKSTLGNFLIYNDHEQKRFLTGNGITSTSMFFEESLPFLVDKTPRIILDTPGALGSNDELVLFTEMNRCITHLNKSKSTIHKILLVIRFGDVISQSKREIIQFYSKILKMSVNNFMIVITRCNSREQEVLTKYRDGFNTVIEYYESLKISILDLIQCKPTIIPIELKPLTDDEKTNALNARHEIFKHSINDQQYSLYHMCKTPSMIRDHLVLADDKKIECIGQRREIKLIFKSLMTQFPELPIESCDSKAILNCIDEIKMKLKDWDTMDPKCVMDEDLSTDLKLLSISDLSISRVFKWPIHEVRINDIIDMRTSQVLENKVILNIPGSYLRRTQVNVKAYTYKRDFYHDDIIILSNTLKVITNQRDDIETAESRIIQLESEIINLLSEYI